MRRERGRRRRGGRDQYDDDDLGDWRVKDEAATGAACGRTAAQMRRYRDDDDSSKSRDGDSERQTRTEIAIGEAGQPRTDGWLSQPSVSDGPSSAVAAPATSAYRCPQLCGRNRDRHLSAACNPPGIVQGGPSLRGEGLERGGGLSGATRGEWVGGLSGDTSRQGGVILDEGGANCGNEGAVDGGMDGGGAVQRRVTA